VGVSGYVDTSHVQKCYQSGMNEVLMKQLDIKKVKELIAKIYL